MVAPLLSKKWTPALFVASALFISIGAWPTRADENAPKNAELQNEAPVEAPKVPLDAKAPDAGNLLKDPPGRVKPLAKRPTHAKLKLISTVTQGIAKEGRKEWRDDRAFRRYSDYSSRVEFGLSNRQIIAALLKRQHSHPALDAYVRWQLLSFAPDFSKAREIDLKRMVATMPLVIDLPSPPKAGNILKNENGSGSYFFSGRQRAFLSDLVPAGGIGSGPKLSVLGSGGGISASTFDPQKAIETARNHTYDYVKAGVTVEYLNAPAIHYRDAFVRMLPTEKGFRLEALFQDLKDRIDAGDPGYKTAAQEFFNEAQRTRNDKSIEDQTRAKLVHQMRDLARKKTRVVLEIQIDNAGNMREKHEVVMFPEKFVPPLLANLKGPPKEAETPPGK